MLAHPGQSTAAGAVSRRNDSDGRLVDPYTFATRGQGKNTAICTGYTAPDHRLNGIHSVSAGIRAPFDALLQTHAESEKFQDGKTGTSAFGAIRSMVEAETTSQAATTPAPVVASPLPLGGQPGSPLMTEVTKWLNRARAEMTTLPATCKDFLSQGNRFEIVFMAVAVVVLISVIVYARR